jgi:hypothetical protein
VPYVVGVREIDVGYRLGGGPFKARIILVTGEALPLSLPDPSDADALLRLAQLFVLGGVRMTATLEDGRVQSLQCEVGHAPRDGH